MIETVQAQLSKTVNEKAAKLGKELKSPVKRNGFSAKFIWEAGTDYFCSLPKEEVKKIINKYSEIK